MLFAAIARFRPGTEAERDKNHEAFSEHLAQPGLRLRLGGSVSGPDGQRTGILLIIEAETIESVRHLAALSPYTKAGVYERLDIEALDIEVGSLG